MIVQLQIGPSEQILVVGSKVFSVLAQHIIEKTWCKMAKTQLHF
jgi:hypothetical protein